VPYYGYGYSDPYYGYGYDTPQDGAAPPATADGYNCSAWRWDATQNRYVQVRAACS
jgi:hypothetical protein